MRLKSLLLAFCSAIFLINCSKNIEYSPEFIEYTSGRYLFSQDEVIEVYYQDNTLHLKWRTSENIKPVIIDQNTFFVADMYKKLRFVEHPNTKQQYLAIVDPENEDNVTYDYKKLADSVHIPSTYLKKGDYKKALQGYLSIKKTDSTSVFIDENEFNRLGYRLLREKKYENAIDVFKINVALYPESSNVYDSLADAYARSGDSLQAFNYYKKTLALDSGNRGAKNYVKMYSKKVDSTTSN